VRPFYSFSDMDFAPNRIGLRGLRGSLTIVMLALTGCMGALCRTVWNGRGARLDRQGPCRRRRFDSIVLGSGPLRSIAPSIGDFGMEASGNQAAARFWAGIRRSLSRAALGT
jgi:hypothetical protein